MGMVLMSAGMRGCCIFCFLGLCVMHAMAVMPVVMVYLGECDLRRKSRDRNQGKGKTSRLEEVFRLILQISSLGCTLILGPGLI
jgi:hypothetical protein